MTDQEATPNNTEIRGRNNSDLLLVLETMKSIKTENLQKNYQIKHNFILQFLPYFIAGDRDNYLAICLYAAKNHLPQIINSADMETSTRKIDELFNALYIFIKEKFYRTDSIAEHEFNILTYYDTDFGTTDKDDLLSKFIHETRHTKDYSEIENTSTANFKNKIIEVVDNKKTELSNINTEVEHANNQLETIQNNLKLIKQDLNFVKLSKAFTSMLREKRREKNISLLACIALATIPIAMPILLIIAHSKFSFFTLEFKTLQELLTIQNALAFLPLATIEIISIYYFRILLQQFYNTKGQVLQLKLRAAICEFIEEYGKFIEENKFADKHYFKQFESLIFSPIVANPDQIPNTLDGIEQIGKIIKSCKP